MKQRIRRLILRFLMPELFDFSRPGYLVNVCEKWTPRPGGFQRSVVFAFARGDVATRTQEVVIFDTDEIKKQSLAPFSANALRPVLGLLNQGAQGGNDPLFRDYEDWLAGSVAGREAR
jgi:hypothetical protein